MRRALLGLVAAALAVTLLPRRVLADNCGSLSDCYGVIAAAIAAAVAIAAIIALIVFLPEILAALGFAGEAGLAAAAEAAGFSGTEAGIITEAESILTSSEMGEIVAAAERGESVVVEVGGRVIQYEPGLPASGMTNFPDGFLIGREAFTQGEGELAKTVLHELYRLATSTVPEGGATAEVAASETEAAAAFAARAYELLKPFLP